MLFYITIVSLFDLSTGLSSNPEVSLPTKCEVCRILVYEVLQRLRETTSSQSLLVSSTPTGSKSIKYDKSELRFYNVFQEPPICNRMLQYKLHKERTGCGRFHKDTPETLRSLRELVQRGVDVKLDVPLEMWDQPSVEITSLFKQCANMLSNHEEAIEEWFFSLQGERDLLQYLCGEKILKDHEKDCLSEPFPQSGRTHGTQKTEL
ncbi:Protein canopy 4 [Clonorchis sinensis]|uniref:Protein canopy 4 n=1 Tax=Clonorchis sinensis TaxID=79923 RepID=A0A8T1MB08_CLOSI|nr:Protein canopy 4 [Clonorchis sinensis]